VADAYRDFRRRRCEWSESRRISAAEITRLRERLKLSQPVFAKLLNTASSTVRKWEQGDTRPAGPALKLLKVIADKGLEALL
jgi:putative transcriptional regulator